MLASPGISKLNNETYPQRSTRFKGSHDTTSKENTIEWHTRMCEFQRPFTSEIRLSIITSTKPTSSNENDVGTSSQSRVHGQNRRVKILERMMTSSSTARPLTNNRKSGVCTSNRNNLTKRFRGTGLQCNILDSKFLETGDPTKLTIK